MMNDVRLNSSESSVNWWIIGAAGLFDSAAPAQAPMSRPSPLLKPAGAYTLASERLEMGQNASIISWLPPMSPVARMTPFEALYCTCLPSFVVAMTPVMPPAASPTSCSARASNTNSASLSTAELYTSSPSVTLTGWPSSRASYFSPPRTNETASG